MSATPEAPGSQAHHGAQDVAHHFVSRKQQFSAAKLGMWVFLTTEILFFSGLFCAYAIYRATHPEIFAWGQQHLDVKLGAINTAVLIFSSFTIAWAVRCAQLNQRKGLVGLLLVTILCGFGFLGIKAAEYEHKWHTGLLWGERFRPVLEGSHEDHSAESPGRQGSAPANSGAVGAAGAATPTDDAIPENAHVFFGIYFAMTGLHGLHVLVGVGVISWILVLAAKGRFRSSYYTPVDLTALYWHLVDLIWIFLFPLLYLIR